MYRIPKTKIGDCSVCEKVDTNVIKRGKDLYCLKCSQKPRKPITKQFVYTSNTELNRWFVDRHKEMKGVCSNCGKKTQKDTLNYKCSIAHILPKAYFKSISTHPSNWVELCFYGNSCHTNFDNNMLDITELNCFDEVIEKFIKMYPEIDESERRRIPSVLLEYVENNK
jgi:hypothetical protein